MKCHEKQNNSGAKPDSVECKTTESNSKDDSGAERPRKTLRARVAVWINEHPEETFTTEQIARHFNIKNSHASNVLSKLVKRGIIAKPSRGLYQAQCRGDVPLNEPETPLLFHHPKLVRKGGHPPNLTTPGNADKVSLLNRDRRRGELLIHADSVELTVSCSENPLEGGELAALLETWDNILGLDIMSNPEAWEMANLDINKDNIGYRIDGVSCITFEPLAGLLLKAYNKHNVLRVEACIHNVPMPEILSFLKGGAADILKAGSGRNRAPQAQAKAPEPKAELEPTWESVKDEPGTMPCPSCGRGMPRQKYGADYQCECGFYHYLLPDELPPGERGADP